MVIVSHSSVVASLAPSSATSTRYKARPRQRLPPRHLERLGDSCSLSERSVARMPTLKELAARAHAPRLTMGTTLGSMSCSIDKP
jgi:hypothetical protein